MCPDTLRHLSTARQRPGQRGCRRDSCGGCLYAATGCLAPRTGPARCSADARHNNNDEREDHGRVDRKRGLPDEHLHLAATVSLGAPFPEVCADYSPPEGQCPIQTAAGAPCGGKYSQKEEKKESTNWARVTPGHPVPGEYPLYRNVEMSTAAEGGPSVHCRDDSALGRELWRRCVRARSSAATQTGPAAFTPVTGSSASTQAGATTTVPGKNPDSPLCGSST